ncbi:PqiC family protein [Candidatus Binatus sp.]|uniref:PqiC family protein n=1 Tax=Candidatus Binatus sp. TaxID=2811406 RepID=UPI003C5791E8
MARRIAQMISIALMAGIAVGCSTAPSRFYSLTSTATADGTPPTSAAVMVGPVTIPASVDQPEFVVQVAPNQVKVDEFNRWVSPLNDSIAHAVAGDLVVLLGTPEVANSQLANFVPDYRVTIDVQRFESIQGQAAVVEAVWTVRKTVGGEVRSGRTVAREPVQGQGFDALAAAHSQAIARMSGDIAAAIRAEAEQKS